MTRCLSKYPVTNEQYLAFVEATESNAPEWMEEGNNYNIYTGSDDYYKALGQALSHPSHPVVGVSWNNAVAFCEWLNAESGKSYRLPSEAEWEYAARGGNASLGFTYAGSNKWKEVGWYELNSIGSTHPVGLKLPNELGIHDMSGNVFEWCADHWHENYNGAPSDGSAWLECSHNHPRVTRGGSFLFHGLNCRVSYRNRYEPHFWNFIIGFRLAHS